MSATQSSSLTHRFEQWLLETGYPCIGARTAIAVMVIPSFLQAGEPRQEEIRSAS